jgi:hypothetical protein
LIEVFHHTSDAQPEKEMDQFPYNLLHRLTICGEGDKSHGSASGSASQDCRFPDSFRCRVMDLRNKKGYRVSPVFQSSPNVHQTESLCWRRLLIAREIFIRSSRLRMKGTAIFDGVTIYITDRNYNN